MVEHGSLVLGQKLFQLGLEVQVGLVLSHVLPHHDSVLLLEVASQQLRVSPVHSVVALVDELAARFPSLVVLVLARVTRSSARSIPHVTRSPVHLGRTQARAATAHGSDVLRRVATQLGSAADALGIRGSRAGTAPTAAKVHRSGSAVISGRSSELPVLLDSLGELLLQGSQLLLQRIGSLDRLAHGLHSKQTLDRSHLPRRQAPRGSASSAAHQSSSESLPPAERSAPPKKTRVNIGKQKKSNTPSVVARNASSKVLQRSQELIEGELSVLVNNCLLRLDWGFLDGLSLGVQLSKGKKKRVRKKARAGLLQSFSQLSSWQEQPQSWH